MAFRFRAAAALDVRRKQEEQARLEVARAEAAVAAARLRRREAEEARDADAERLAEVQQAGAEAWRIEWHRSWIERQRQVLDARAQDVAACVDAAAAAVRVAQEALKKRRTLERLRDRAYQRYTKAAQQRDLQEMNDLATLRYVAQAMDQGGTRAD